MGINNISDTKCAEIRPPQDRDCQSELNASYKDDVGNLNLERLPSIHSVLQESSDSLPEPVTPQNIQCNDQVVDRMHSVDSFDYIYEAALQFSDAARAEVGGQYQDALKLYQLGIDKLNYGADLDVQPERRQIARDQSKKYLKKLKYIFKNLKLDDAIDCQEVTVLERLEVDKQNATNRVSMERPTHHLEKFKVIDILNTVMQVQDTSNGTLYIMKVSDL